MGFQEEPTEEGGVPRPGRRPLIRYVGLAEVRAETHKRFALPSVIKLPFVFPCFSSCFDIEAQRKRLTLRSETGDTTSVAALKRASRGSRWSGAGQTRGSTSSPTPASTTTPCPPIAAPSPGAHATSFQVLPAPPLPRGMAASAPPPPTPKPVPRPRPPQLGCPPPPRSLPPWTTSLSAADQRKGKTAWTRRKRWKKKMTRACSWWRTWR